MIGKKLIVSILVFLLIIIALLSVWFYFYILPKEKLTEEGINYLIPGVPYNGFYNLYFHQADLTAVPFIMSILGYWGDQRFDLSYLKEKFPRGEFFSSLEIKEFFEENGYSVFNWLSQEAGGELEQVKEFVNPESKTPVIVFQKSLLDPENFTAGYRLVIGIFDKDEKVVVHDNYLGNNYEISYNDFKMMFQSDNRAVLAVWPSNSLKGVVDGPDDSAVYPSRLDEMDKLGSLLTVKLLKALHYARLYKDEPERVTPLFKDFVDDADFKYLPSAFQVSFLSYLANWHLGFLENPDEAIRIITEQVLPLNHDINQAPEGWFAPPQEKLAAPYYLLAQAYLQKNQRELALENYQEMKQIEAFNKDAYQAMLELLEKELYP